MVVIFMFNMFYIVCCNHNCTLKKFKCIQIKMFKHTSRQDKNSKYRQNLSLLKKQY